MTNRIEGWCIVDSETGERILKFYENKGSAKISFNASWANTSGRNSGAFEKQTRYILQPLILLEGPNGN